MPEHAHNFRATEPFRQSEQMSASRTPSARCNECCTGEEPRPEPFSANANALLSRNYRGPWEHPKL